MKLSDKHRRALTKMATEHETLMLRLLIECWNAEAPHFGGGGPHRYDGADKTCSYCGRPSDWKKVNAGFVALDLTGK